jgi:hypothetical protein
VPDHFVICGSPQLRYWANEFVAHSNAERPHRAKCPVPLYDADENETRLLPFPYG